jgi:6-pyruvoyltetrahydropterin/6-carboxytetrahydropterin synthase
VIIATRYHDFSCGHRVVGHESKCALLHGHNYRVHFTCAATALDPVGRVLDFSVIKEKLCMWVENKWDHKFLAYSNDPVMHKIVDTVDELQRSSDTILVVLQSIVWVPFNPTAENMADYLLREVGPRVLKGTGVTLTQVTIDETRKCSATASLLLTL